MEKPSYMYEQIIHIGHERLFWSRTFVYNHVLMIAVNIHPKELFKSSTIFMCFKGE